MVPRHMDLSVEDGAEHALTEETLEGPHFQVDEVDVTFQLVKAVGTRAVRAELGF